MLALTSSQCQQELSIDLIFNDRKILCRLKLEKEEEEIIQKLIEFTLSQHLPKYVFSIICFLFISWFSINLIEAVEVMANIARQRSNYMIRIVQTYEELNGNRFHSTLIILIFEHIKVRLSSLLDNSYVSNLRKIIKLKLINFLKYSTSLDCQSQIIRLLTDLATTETEVYVVLSFFFNQI